jgi:hypothetical protein
MLGECDQLFPLKQVVELAANNVTALGPQPGVDDLPRAQAAVPSIGVPQAEDYLRPDIEHSVENNADAIGGEIFGVADSLLLVRGHDHD